MLKTVFTFQYGATSTNSTPFSVFLDTKFTFQYGATSTENINFNYVNCT